MIFQPMILLHFLVPHEKQNITGLLLADILGSSVTSTKNSPCLLYCLRQNTECIMQRAFCFIQDLLGGTTQDY